MCWKVQSEPRLNQSEELVINISEKEKSAETDDGVCFAAGDILLKKRCWRESKDNGKI